MNDDGIAVGIDHIPELCNLAHKNISKNHSDLLNYKKIILIEGDGRKGYIDMAPYNCIHVGAGIFFMK
jgi:protein-L-isoaspartate(D-aspartate) O-methyltransferase